MKHEKSAFNLAEQLWQKMEDGLAPWQKTWKPGYAPGRARNISTDHLYRGGNAFWLMMVASMSGWTNEWITFAEIAKLGGNIKGQSPTRIEVPLFKKKEDPVTGEEKEVLYGFRVSTVFNIAQVQDITIQSKEAPNLVESVASVEMMLEALKAQGMSYKEGTDDGCWYQPETDTVGMPHRGAFEETYEFYAGLAHEMSHATMSKGRVERDPVSYAYEELRAEMASTLICSTLNLPRTQWHVDNHAAYLKSWLSEFSDQKPMLLKAAAEAQLIHDYLIALTEQKVELALAA